jgi:cbb3-type cytochrome oxidase cytochrome c subunit
MKGLTPLFLGIFGTFAFSWIALTVIPTWQIGHLNPESDEEGTEIYPRPQSGMFERGGHVYAANGCVYCHSQQVRADYAADDIERKWGNRRSAPRDYIFDRPVFLGKMRMGQDLANIGARAPAEAESPAPATGASPATQQGAAVSSSPAEAAAAPSPAAGSPPTKAPTSPAPAAAAASPAPASSPGTPAASPASSAPKTPGPAPAGAPSSPSPAAAAASPAASPTAQTPGAPWPIQTAGLPPMYSAAWHHVHLYSPRSINLDSNMPSYRFLYEKRRIAGERSADALQLSGSDAPPEGWEVVPSYDAKCLVAYLLALNQSHPLKEARLVGGAPAPAASPAPAVQGASPGPAAAGSPAAPKK